MKRPLPPDLLDLGDRLERAVMAALARKQVRRQHIFNAVASLMVAVPLVVSLGTSQFSPATTIVDSTPIAALEQDSPTNVPDDVLPRDMRRQRPTPNAELLVLPSNLRPALR